MHRLNIYPQTRHHDEAMIIGDRGALLALRDAIDIALNNDQIAGVDVAASDGEGYECKIKLIEADEPQWDTFAPFYTSERC